MYILKVINEKVTVSPDRFNLPLEDALNEQIELKYVNKVLPGVGLCVCLFDILHVGDPYIYPREGGTIQDINFRLVIFRPFVGEILTGKIVNSDEQGLRVSMGFFDNISIDHSLLQEPKSFDEESKIWSWKYSDGGEEGTSDSFSLDLDEVVSNFLII